MKTIEICQVHICDDIKEHALQLESLLQKLDNNISFQITISSAAEDFINQLTSIEQGKTSPWDIIFMDIRLPESDGISLGKKIREICPDSYLIFTTAYAEYAIQGYEASAYRYLLKPVTTDDLLALTSDIQKDLDKKEKILIKEKKNSVYLSLNDILYISAEDKYTIVYTKNNHFISDMSLNKYEEQLGNHGFYRIHRKYLVNIRHHRGIFENKVEISNGTLLSISKSKIKAYQSQIFCYMHKSLV
ncbi:MAG: response regulator transcription factor [Lachnospiraceae bacterium]|nr:response regulator transcription factor [Lachnospiraceae bacterium]